ncbi:hypothetical protein AcV7_004797 [Taiwanofungus camphoratus]|nr:hypothetical protein AcV7_004797 [Antrodia cinnamomea]
MNVHIWHVRQLCGARCVARHGQAVVRHRCAFSTGRTADLIARATPVLCVEMLIPVDQPLDKLDDLTPDEIDNMKGWMEHFSNKYIVCGKLVENDAVRETPLRTSLATVTE